MKKITEYTFLILFLFSLFLIQCSPESPSEANSETALDSLILIEPEGSAYYSKSDNKWRVSLEGEIVNKAITTNYKDFTIEIEYYSETNTLLETSKLIVYKEVLAGKRLFVRNYIDTSPKNSASSVLKWKLLGATPF